MNDYFQNVLLTDSGFYLSNELSKPNAPLINRLRDMVGKSFADATVLLIPTAAKQDEAKAQAITHRLRNELLAMNFQPCNITIYDIDGTLSEADVLQYDMMYITGGKTPYLAKRVREADFDKIIRAFIAANKVYIGMSAGSMLLTPHFNQDEPDNADFDGLGIYKVYLSVHCAPGTPHRTDLPLPHIALCENQAIAVTSDGYEVIGVKSDKIKPTAPLGYAIHDIDPTLRGQVQFLVDESWSGPFIVANGKMHDTRTLPGYAAVYDGEVLGYLLFELRNDECEIMVLESITPNIGIATTLIERVIQTANANNAHKIVVRTTNDNTHALRFYQRRGFIMSEIRLNIMEAARMLKPTIPYHGMDGISMRDEITFALHITQ